MALEEGRGRAKKRGLSWRVLERLKGVNEGLGAQVATLAERGRDKGDRGGGSHDRFLSPRITTADLFVSCDIDVSSSLARRISYTRVVPGY